MAYSYLRNDAVSAITYPSNNAGGTGEQVTYVYDTATGEPSTMAGTNNYVTDTDYHAAGMVTSMTHLTANTVNRSNIYQASTLYLTWTQAGTGTSTNNVHQYAFNYDSFGRVTSLRDVKNTNQYQCFTYNQWNRLKTAFTTGDSACGAYDGAVPRRDPSWPDRLHRFQDCPLRATGTSADGRPPSAPRRDPSWEHAGHPFQDCPLTATGTSCGGATPRTPRRDPS